MPLVGCPHSVPNSSILPDLLNSPDSASSGEKSEPWSVLQDTHPAIGLLLTLVTPQILGKRASYQATWSPHRELGSHVLLLSDTESGSREKT